MCTQAQYNYYEANDQLIQNAYYFITDDTTAEDLESHMDAIDGDVGSLEGRTDTLEETSFALAMKIASSQIQGEHDYYDLEDILNDVYDQWVSQGRNYGVREYWAYEDGTGGYYLIRPAQVTNNGDAEESGFFLGEIVFLCGSSPNESGLFRADISELGEGEHPDWEIEWLGKQKSPTTPSILKAGLYAVYVGIGTFPNVSRETFMLSVDSLAVAETNSSVSRPINGVSYYATYSPSTHAVTINATGGQAEAIDIQYIRVITEY